MRSDCNKVYFNNEATANEYIKKLKRTSIRLKVPQRAYLCPKCFCWHLTSQDSNEEKEIAELRKAHEKKITALNNQIQSMNQQIFAQKRKLTNQAQTIAELHHKCEKLKISQRP